MKTLCILAQKGDLVSKVFANQGIRDIIEEYIVNYRDMFQKKMIKNYAITDGAFLMWKIKQKKILKQWQEMDDDDLVLYESLIDIDLYCLGIYYLYPSHRKPLNENRMTLNTFMSSMMAERLIL